MKPFLKLVSLLVNLRVLLVLCTLGLLVAPLSVSWFGQPNLWLFRVGVQLSPKPEPSNNLIKVNVNQLELERFVKDVPSASGLGELLQGLRMVYTKTVVLLLDQLPETENYTLELLAKSGIDTSGSVEFRNILERQETFRTGVTDGVLILGIAQTEHPVNKVNYLKESQRVIQSNELIRPTPLAPLLAYDRGAFNKSVLELAPFKYESRLQGFAFYNGVSVAYPLLWDVKGAIFPDIALEILKKSYGAKQITQSIHSISLDDHVIPVSAGAVIYPFYSTASGKMPPIETVSLEDIRAAKEYSRFHNKIVLIGAKGSPQLENLAAAFYSLDKKAYYTVPPWYLLAEKGGLSLLFFYVFFLLPRLRVKLALTVTSFVALVLLIISLGMQISEKQWLPMGLLLAYLLAGQLLVLWRQLISRWFGEWELVVVEKGKVPVRNAFLPTRHEPKLAGVDKRLSTPSKLGQMLDKTMAITKPGKKLKFGRYEVDRELGRGAMGVVYLGHDPLIDRLVAIKTLNYAQFAPHELIDVKNRFFREAKAVGKFAHDNIVTIFDTGEDDQRAFIAMEYVEGKPLSLYTKKNTLIKNIDEVYWLMESVADALHYAHEKGVVHRDIKPANILYDVVNHKVKVSDFGIARIVDSSATRTGEIMGSPLYMSPEQVKGETVTGKTDIYSLGVTFYQLLTGELPFTGDTIPAITHQIVQGKFAPVTDVNPKLPQSAQKIIAKAMHKDPQRRYADAGAMMEDIAKWRDKDF